MTLTSFLIRRTGAMAALLGPPLPCLHLHLVQIKFYLRALIKTCCVSTSQSNLFNTINKLQSVQQYQKASDVINA